MPMSSPIALEWASPLEYLAALEGSGVDYALLYSGMETSYSGRYSLLAMHPEVTIESENFSALADALTTDAHPYENCWIGYLGYGLKHARENLTIDAPSHIALPHLTMRRYHTVLVFDHAQQRLTCHRRHNSSPLPPSPQSVADDSAVTVSQLRSDMTKQEYLDKVKHIKHAIRAGTLYQANLTRKFYGQLDSTPSIERLFSKLAQVSPAPYSALLKSGDLAILSSSPERFLRLDATGRVEVRPIKGSAPRVADSVADAAIRDALARSEKDRAENLMIVDLMRNDLSRSCAVGSVKTDALFEVSTYATVHHMASTVSGQLQEGIAPVELVARCFPPGSMTGAPKIKAMELCSALEPRGRGVYSGAIGWFGGDGSVDLSVVIRTLIIRGQDFEFQVGGAIVDDSTPEGEWEETLFKARGLAAALHLPLERLRAL